MIKKKPVDITLNGVEDSESLDLAPLEIIIISSDLAVVMKHLKSMLNEINSTADYNNDWIKDMQHIGRFINKFRGYPLDLYRSYRKK